MSAFEELSRDGRVGEQTVELFVWCVSAAVRRHRYPPPAGSAAWTHAVCLEWVIDLFDKKGPDIAIRLFAHAGGQTSFAKLVRRTVENELKDQAKATTAGKLRGRMRTLLAKETDFVDATPLFGGDPAWTLDGFDDAVYVGDWVDLLYAPTLKLIEPIRELNAAGPTSKANTDKLVSAARIILTEAGLREASDHDGARWDCPPHRLESRSGTRPAGLLAERVGGVPNCLGRGGVARKQATVLTVCTDRRREGAR